MRGHYKWSAVGALLAGCSVACPELDAVQFGTATSDEVNGLAVGSDGSTAVVGTIRFGGFSGPHPDAFVRVHAAGWDERWAREISTPEFDYALAVAIDLPGNVIVAGATRGELGGSADGHPDAYVRVYDSVGGELWTRQWGASHSAGASAVAVDPSGNYVLAGSAVGEPDGWTAEGDGTAFVRVYGRTGEELWSRRLVAGAPTTAVASLAANENGVVLAGTVLDFPAGSGSDPFVRVYDAAGSELWTRQFGAGSLNEAALAMSLDSAGRIVVVGHTDGDFAGPSMGDFDAFVSVLDPTGGEVWSRQFGTSSRDQATSVAVGADDRIFVVGTTEGQLEASCGENVDVFVRAYDAMGAELWTRQFGSSLNDESPSVAVGPAGDVFVAGQTGAELGGMSAGGNDAFVFRLSPEGEP